MSISYCDQNPAPTDGLKPGLLRLQRKAYV